MKIINIYLLYNIFCIWKRNYDRDEFLNFKQKFELLLKIKLLLQLINFQDDKILLLFTSFFFICRLFFEKKRIIDRTNERNLLNR